MASVSYRRAVAVAALQAALSSTWIAARELPPARRRLARLGTVAAMTAVSWATSPKEPEPESGELAVATRPYLVSEPQSLPGDEPGDTFEETFEDALEVAFDKRKAALGIAMLGLTAAAVAGRRTLEKRWLARLTRNGHPHPTRALAVRIGAVEFAGQLALQVAEAHRTAARPRS